MSFFSTRHALLWILSVTFCVASTALGQNARAVDESTAKMGVALAISLPDADPRHREMAAGIVLEAGRRWMMLEPQLTQEAVSQCAADEKCLVGLAQSRQASHLLSVGIAALDRVDFVVSIKLIDLIDGSERVSHADIGKPGFHPRDAGVTLARQLFARIPPAAAPTAAPAGLVDTASSNSALSWQALAGWSLSGMAAVVGGGTFVFWLTETAEPQKTVGVNLGSIATAALGCVGLGLLVWNELE